MSLMALKRTITKFGVPIGIVLGIFMIIGVVLPGLGMNLGGAAAQPTEKAEVEKPAAMVGEVPVSRRMLDDAVEGQVQQQRMYGAPTPTPAMMAQMRTDVLESAKSEAALLNLAKASNINPSAEDITRMREDVWAKSERGKYASALGLKADATDSEIDAALVKQNPGASILRIKQGYPEDRLRLMASQTALLNKYKSEIKADAATVKQNYSEIKVRHILIASGKNGLPEGQARERATKLLAELKADVNKMPALAGQYSDDPGSKKKGGLYDWAPASRYVPEFSQAALKAGVGKLYPEIVPTPYGFHIVKNEGIRAGKDMPKDFDKNSQKYVDEYKQTLASSKLQSAVQKAKEVVKVDITDPALKADQLQVESQTAMNKTLRDAKLMQALVELGKVDKKSDPLGHVPLQKASIYETLDRPKESAAAYIESLDYRNTIEARIMAARQYLKVKDSKSAVEQLEKAGELPVSDITTQIQIAQMLKEAGRADLSKAAFAKAQDLQKRMADAMKRQMEEAKAKASASGPGGSLIPTTENPAPITGAPTPPDATNPPTVKP